MTRADDASAVSADPRGEAGVHEHFVQLYEDDATIVASVEAFIRQGLRDGAAAVVIATRAHLDQLEQQWKTEGLDLEGACKRGQYVALDAAETLSRLLVGGWPQPELFAKVVEPVIEKASRGHQRVVAFGEMVALLWKEGRYGAAVQLEDLWNDLGRRYHFALFCAYRIARDGRVPDAWLSRMCARHGRVITDHGAASPAAPADPAVELAEIVELQEKVRRGELEIAQRKSLELLLARRERELEDLLESVPQPLHSVSADGRIQWANHAELELLGHARAEYVGQPLEAFYADSPGAPGAVGRLLAGEALRNTPMQVRCRDGTRKDVVVDCTALWEDGAFLRSRCVLRDLTREQEADRDRALLAAIVTSSDDAIISKTLQGVITSWNSGAERIFGYAAQEVIGKPISILIPPELQDEEPQILAKMARGERIDHFETTRVTKFGERIDISLTISPVRDAHGAIIGVSKVARDVTARKRIEAQLRDADRRKDEFLAMLGHELRNPLAPIRNVTEVLRRTAGGNGSQAQLCTVLERQVAQMTRLLDDLLDVSRITQGKIQFRHEPVDMLTVVARAVETTRPLIDERGHHLHVNLPERTLRVTGDLARLVQAVANLLNNAAKYTPPGGEIRLSVEAEDGAVVLRVRDNGVGITAELLPRIFDLFVQADRTLERSQGGLGIGLTLVSKITERHGGKVQASSAGVGQGSEFAIRLPMLNEERRARAAEAPPPPPRSGDRATKRVLVVDDNADAAESMAILLRMMGHEVTVVAESTGALQAVGPLNPDLIVLDVGLPGMNGYDLARRLRADGCAATLVAVTGYGQPEDRRLSREAGIDHHFVKPVDPDEIARLLG
jgi:PAS domain S-box-containing protein